MFKKMSAVVGAVVGAVIGASVGSAQAALDPSIATGLTSIQTDATSLAGLVWPVLFTILGFLIMMKLAKRFGNKI
jgi:hypothetical protein